MTTRTDALTTWECVHCCNFGDGKKPTRCPACDGRKLVVVYDGREKGDDDGLEYSDPRDERDERRGL